MNAAQAKKIIKAKLDELGLPYTKLTAKKVGFQDLARADCMFVYVHGWTPHESWDVLDKLAKDNGFRVMTAGGIN
jgi:hypothetical protein